MSQMKTLNKQHICYYLTALVILLLMKLFSENANADTLRFLLAPVANLVGLICKAPFLWEPHKGYISHDLRFLIAASCSGINFMIITTGMLLFSFRHYMTKHTLWHILWPPLCLILSYCYTILTNAVRIVLAIYLPVYLEKQGLVPALLSHDTLHTLIGTVVYFSALLILYPSGHSARVPFFWYVGIVWGLPFTSRILHQEFTGFGRYTMIIFGSCLMIYVLKKLIFTIPMRKHPV